MKERLSDDDLDRLDELIRWEHDGGGTGQELADMARDLLSEVRAARAREAASEWEYGLASTIEDGEVFVWQEFLSAEAARAVVGEGDFVVRQRRSPWEPVTGGDDDEQQ